MSTMKEVDSLKIAITHDYLTEYGGAEMVLWEILKAFPQADLYTAIIRPNKKQRAFWLEISKHKVKSSFLSSLPIPRPAYKLLLSFQIRFFKRLNLDKYDLVISSSAGFSKFINTNKKTKHIAYIHTPPRFLWGYDTSTFHRFPGFVRLIFKPLLARWRRKDVEYAGKADLIVTNSKNIQSKIKQVYKKDSKIVYPPADIKNLLQEKPVTKQDYFLTIGRLYPYKKIDLIVRAFKGLDKKLIVVGDGIQRRKLEKISKKNVEFRGFVDEDIKIELLQKARGFVFAADEDFGIVMVEALAAGTPVIAYKEGGAKEIVQDGENGILFEEQSVQSIRNAISKFTKQKFDAEVIQESSKKFSSEHFREEMRKLIASI